MNHLSPDNGPSCFITKASERELFGAMDILLLKLNMGANHISQDRVLIKMYSL